MCRDSNAGLASAVIEGAHQATHDIVLVMDADLSHPPEKIADMVMPLLDGTHDMVIGSRYVAGRCDTRMATGAENRFQNCHDPGSPFYRCE